MKKGQKWLVGLLSSGLVIALVTFFVEKAWERIEHAEVGPQYVDASIRVEGDQLIVFIRNNSDEPLDLVAATIDVADETLRQEQVLGAYPDISHVYEVRSSRGAARLERADAGLTVRVDIAQAIQPKQADQFGLKLTGLAGPVDLSDAKIQARLTDMKGNTYVVTR